jgi:hypothetical protein
LRLPTVRGLQCSLNFDSFSARLIFATWVVCHWQAGRGSTLGFVDEWQLEMGEIRDTLVRLKAHDGDPVIIEELEAELRILDSLYQTAQRLFDTGVEDRDLRIDFGATGMGDWSFENVYSFVYETAMQLELGRRELSSLVPEVDYEDLIRQAAQ